MLKRREAFSNDNFHISDTFSGWKYRFFKACLWKIFQLPVDLDEIPVSLGQLPVKNGYLSVVLQRIPV